MKKETGIIIAAGVGFLAVLGLLAIRKYLSGNDEEYYDYYSDFHRHFDKRYRNEDHHGIEYLSIH